MTNDELSVLVVEERVAERRALELALALRGHDVRVATVAASLEAVADHAPALVIIGALSGGANAVAALCRAIRSLPRGAEPGIYVIADPARPDEIVAALDAGATSYLRDPLDAAQMRERLDQAARDARARAGDATETVSLREREARYRALVEHHLDLIAILDVDGGIRFVSPAAEALLGQPPADLVGGNFFALAHSSDAGELLSMLTAALNDPGPTAPIEIRLLRRDDRLTTAELCATNLQDVEGVGGIVVYARDITERKQMEEQLERRALYDPLTTLPNRTLFMDYLEHALARADRRLESIVVLFTDLDNFKLINDSFGHAFGDQVLTRVAERLRACLRSSDTAARLSGDEFTVLLEDIAAQRDAVIVAERIIRELGSPFFIDGHEVFVTISIGIAVSTPGESRPGDLLRDADIALYRAKAAGKARWAIFSVDLTPPRAEQPRAHREPPSPPEPAPVSDPVEPLAAQLEPEPAPVPGPGPAPSAEPPPSPPLITPSPSVTPPPPPPGNGPDIATLQSLLTRIAELEREAGRLEARLHPPEGAPGRD